MDEFEIIVIVCLVANAIHNVLTYYAILDVVRILRVKEDKPDGS